MALFLVSPSAEIKSAAEPRRELRGLMSCLKATLPHGGVGAFKPCIAVIFQTPQAICSDKFKIIFFHGSRAAAI